MTESHKIILAIAGLFCTVYFGFLGIILGVFSDTFARTTDGSVVSWLGVPLRHKAQHHRYVMELEALEDSIPSNSLTFVFIIDCSRSISQKINTKAAWPREVINSLALDSYPVPNTKSILNQREEVEAYHVLNTAMFAMLRRTVEVFGSEEASSHRFAVWSVCTKVDKVYPPNDKSALLTRENVDEATRRVDNREYNKVETDWTELLGLFDRVRNTYRLNEQPDYDSRTQPKHIISIISDFEDSTRTPAPERSHRLRQSMNNIITSRAQINLITVGSAAAESSVVAYFEANSDWYRLNMSNIFHDLPTSITTLIMPVVSVDRPIMFFYDNPSYGKSTAALRLAWPGPIEMTLPFLTASDSSVGRVTYGFRLQPKEKDDVKTDILGRIWPGRPSRLEAARQNDLVDLTFDGAIPTKHQLLKLTVSAEKRAYLLPLIFAPRLPVALCNLMIFLYSLPMIGIGGCLFMMGARMLTR